MQQRRYAPLKALLVIILTAFTSACKINIIMPEGGRVVSSGGLSCEEGQSCAVDVSSTQFDQTFSAQAKPGYRFSHWRKNHRFFCGGQATPCHLYTTAFGTNAGLLSFLSKPDEIFYLQPVFVKRSSYDLSYWQQVVADIDNRTYAQSRFLYRLTPDIANCDPGELSAAAKQRALQATNAVRALVELPPVTISQNDDSASQQGALIQKANNFLSHNPPTNAKCYTAAGASVAGSANLSLSSRLEDPAQDVIGWANDNHNVSTLAAAGHRRWLLFPTLQYISYGQVDGGAALKVFNFSTGGNPVSTTMPDYVAFPYRDFPYVLISKGNAPTPWSLSIVPASGNLGHNYFAQAQVSITNDQTGQSLNVHSLYHDTSGYGLRNFFSWMVDDWEHDTRYTVTISPVIFPGGEQRTISYPVLIDRFNLVDLQFPLEAGDSQQTNSISGRFDGRNDRDSYSLSLSGTVKISGRNSQFSNQPYFVSVYDPKKRLIASNDGPLNLNLTPANYTLVVSLCNEKGSCYRGISDYSITIDR